MRLSDRSSVVAVLGCCAALALLWLPGLKYPVVSDAVHYGVLGRSLWETGRYVLEGIPYANHLPLHAFVSYPFTELLGFHAGMHATSLFGGFLTLVATFLLARRVFPSPFPLLATLAVLLHPAFVLMAMLGSADLLFAGLFLLSLWIFLGGENNRRGYVAAGILAGLASITRYNGLPLFLLFLGWTAWKHPKRLRDPAFLGGLAAGGAIFGLWLLRNAIAFGDPFHSGYTAELAREAPDLLREFFVNVRYYVNPVHNVFPFFFPFGLWGLWRHGRARPFLVLAMLAGALVSMIWWVQAIRFVFPSLVLFLFFAVLGIDDLLRRFRYASPVVIVVATLGLATQALSFCVYTYGECNAWLDRRLPLPPNMGLTTEGFYAWHLARNFINETAELEAVVLHEFPEESKGIFREDLRVDAEKSSCPIYRITQRPEEGELVVFTTEAHPKTSVTLQECVR